jgi:hypothetical protein
MIRILGSFRCGLVVISLIHVRIMNLIGRLRTVGRCVHLGISGFLLIGFQQMDTIRVVE